MIYLYTNIVSNRLNYTASVLFQAILKVEIKILTDIHVFNSLKNVPKFNYSHQPLSDSFWIKPHTLLFEKDIEVQDIAVTHVNGIPYFFKTNYQADFPYDLFAMAFYVMTRYEEYLPFKGDAHSRFSAATSLAYKANFLHLPVVHFWAKELQNKILEQYPDFLFPPVTFNVLNTIDIDVAYAYKGKPFYRQMGGFIKSVFQFDYLEIKNRIWYYLNRKDPYDTYTYLTDMIKKSGVETIFFIQMGRYGTFDKNIPPNKTLKDLLTRLTQYGEIGIHPSYNSNYDHSELKVEVSSLEKIVLTKVGKSRQHFLKLQFPETYENLISQGITTDFTLGFADHIGFRAGMCCEFPFFNLRMNEQRPLMLVPFQIMDGTLKDYQKFNPEEAIVKVMEIKKGVESVNGTFVTIFHNSSLTEKGAWKNWRSVFERVISVL